MERRETTIESIQVGGIIPGPDGLQEGQKETGHTTNEAIDGKMAGGTPG